MLLTYYAFFYNTAEAFSRYPFNASSFIINFSLQLLIAVFSFVYGNPIRIINGYDSFGNTCGSRSNKRIGNLELSGVDTLDKPYLLFFDIKELRKSLKICVKQCPNRTLSQVSDINKYYQDTGVKLCQYDFKYSDFFNNSIQDKKVLSGTFGPCPVLPIYDRYKYYLLMQCIQRQNWMFLICVNIIYFQSTST